MIRELTIKNFKSHKDTTIRLGNLTVLCGKNSVGKSSLIQSLLLLRQTDMKNRLSEALDLNDPLCFIGKTKDALYQFTAEEGIITFSLTDDKKKNTWNLAPNKKLLI